MWTTHGHQIIGTIALDPISNDRPRIARCGGPEICKRCQIEVKQAQKDADLNEFGNKTELSEEVIPVLNDESTIDRMLGRVKLALIVAKRPSSEIEAICEKLSMMCAEHKVLMDQRQPED